MVVATINLSNSDLWAISVGCATVSGLLGIACPEPFVSKAITVISLVVAGIGAAY